MNEPAVLLVEDSGFMARHTSGTLESIRDMTVRTAETANQARTMLQDGDFDCLVVNTQLPDENGIEFAQSIRDDSNLPPVAPLLFTSGDLESVAVDAFEAGVIDVVSKDHHAGDSMEVFANRIEVAIDAFEYRKRAGIV
ncbi:MAG: response regulator [Natronomonas sp.]